MICQLMMNTVFIKSPILSLQCSRKTVNFKILGGEWEHFKFSFFLDFLQLSTTSCVTQGFSNSLLLKYLMLAASWSKKTFLWCNSQADKAVCLNYVDILLWKYSESFQVTETRSTCNTKCWYKREQHSTF